MADVTGSLPYVLELREAASGVEVVAGAVGFDVVAPRVARPGLLCTLRLWGVGAVGDGLRGWWERRDLGIAGRRHGAVLAMSPNGAIAARWDFFNAALLDLVSDSVDPARGDVSQRAVIGVFVRHVAPDYH